MSRVLATLIAWAVLTTPSLALDKYDNIHTAGIISAIGDSVTLQYAGEFPWDNEQHLLQTRDWGLDAMVTAQIQSAIGQRFVIKPIAADPGPLEVNIVQFWDSENDVLQKFIRALPAENGVDAYIVVRKLRVPDPIDNTKQVLWGLGLYRHQWSSARPTDAVYGLFDVDVVDARTGDIIDSGTARTPGSGGIFGPDWLWARDAAADWAATPQGMTAEQTQSLKSHLTGLVRVGLDEALRRANLLAANPAPPP